MFYRIFSYGLQIFVGSEIVSTFDHPELVKVGHCDLIEEIIIGEDKLVKFSGVAAGEACTIVLRGATHQLLDEAERSLHDALCVLTQTVKEPATTLGGGCAEMLMAKAVEELAVLTAGKKAIAIEAFARALRQVGFLLKIFLLCTFSYFQYILTTHLSLSNHIFTILYILIFVCLVTHNHCR